MIWLWFLFGLLGTLGHILWKLKHQGKKRFYYIWKYVKENQIPVTFSIFTYLAVFILWNMGFLSKLFPIMLFEIPLSWGSIVIAYFSDSIWRNLSKDVKSAVERKRNH